MIEALTGRKPRIDDAEELDRVVRRLVAAFDPIAIYLFGSRARGNARDKSDYDLMLVLADDNARVRSRRAVWDTARSERITVNPFLTQAGAFAWRRHEVGTLEYEVQVDGVKLYPATGTDLRVVVTGGGERPSMNVRIVEEWLEKVRRDLVMARKACEGDDAVPDQAAFHVQQAAEKLTKAALVALQKRPRKGHEIGEFAKRLPARFALRERFLGLARFTKFVWMHRYPGEAGAPPEPEPSAAEARAWIGEVEALKVDFEGWLGERAARS
jgi:HEPN domain-containing protein